MLEGKVKRWQNLVVAILVILGLFIVAVKGILSRNLKEDAFEAFQSRVTTSHRNMKEDFDERYTAIDRYVRQTVNEAEDLLAEYGITANQIAANPQATDRLLQEVTDNVIATLRFSGATEAFFILDGTFQEYGAADQKAGLHISKMKAAFYDNNNEDLICESGRLAESKQWRLEKGKEWQEGISLHADSNYFHMPLRAARTAKLEALKDYAYWEYGELPYVDTEVLTYSLPLITSQGEVFGVMGIGIRKEHLREYMSSGEEWAETYLLTRSRDGRTHEPLLSSEGSKSASLSIEGFFELRPDKNGVTQVYVNDNKESGYYASSCSLFQYPPNSPFVQETWQILGIQKGEKLFAVERQISGLFSWMAIGLCVFFVLGIYWLRRLSKLSANMQIADRMANEAALYRERRDPLTGIYSRKTFEEKIKELFLEPDLLQTAVLAVWDMDNLKYVNDTYGHPMGDAYILAFAECLRKFQKEKVIYARRTGDEFITLIYGSSSKKELLYLMQELWELIRAAKINLPNGEAFRLRVSGGMAWYPEDADNYEQLFSYADFAMYTVKHQRKGTVQEFEPKLYQSNKILLQGQEAFNNLLDRQLVSFMLQPIVTVKEGKIYGYEMLMRSNVDIFKSPGDILRFAESQSKLYDMEVLTWFEAMKTFVEQIKKEVVAADSHVFINSIGNQKLHMDMLEAFQTVYADYLSQIVCEFTEEQQVDLDFTKEKQVIFHEWGALTALDDYGGGYNSESILLEITPDIIKIDRNLVTGIHKDKSRRHLVENLVSYARQRNILVLGEGVETKEELQTLVALGVDLLQGYYIGRPSYDGVLARDSVRQEIMGEIVAQAAETLYLRT